MHPRRKPPALLTTAVLLGTLLAVPVAALAQTEPPVDSVTVALWPEYDRAEVLVIYRVLLPQGSPMPARVRLPIPGDAPDLTAVAYRDPGGGLLNAVYDRVEGEPFDTVIVQTEGIEIQLEFYAPLSRSGDQRSFDYAWPGGMTAAGFDFEVQQPFGAESMDLSPAATSRTTDLQGLIYHRLATGPLGPQDQPRVSFRYTKSDDRLSADVVGPPAALAPPPTTPAPSIDLQALLPYGLLVAGVGLLAAGVVYFFRTRQAERRPRPRHRPAAARDRDEREVDASPAFCHSCGAQASASDRFCRRCGSALRG